MLHVINHYIYYLLFLTTLRSGALICYHRRPILLLVPQSRKRCYAPELEAEDALPNVNRTQAAENGHKMPFFVPGHLNL